MINNHFNHEFIIFFTSHIVDFIKVVVKTMTQKLGLHISLYKLSNVRITIYLTIFFFVIVDMASCEYCDDLTLFLHLVPLLKLFLLYTNYNQTC